MIPSTPRTPPRSTQMESWIPPTPRYAPIDEPDNYPWSKHSQTLDSQSDDALKASKCSTPRCDSEHLLHRTHHGKQTPKKSVSSLVLPLTPEQTPVRPKRKKHVDEIDSANDFTHSSRIMFPTGTPIKGSGRSYNSPRHSVCPSSSIETLSASTSQKQTQTSRHHCSKLNNHMPAKYTQINNFRKHNHIQPDETTRIESLTVSTPQKHRSVHVSSLTGDEEVEDFEVFDDKTPFLDEIDDETNALEYAGRNHKRQKTTIDPFIQRLQQSVKKKRLVSNVNFETSPNHFESITNINKINGREYDSEKYFDVLEDAYFRSKGLVKDKKQPEVRNFHYRKEQHPHDLQQGPDKIPGMWFVFRGKKVFRPYTDGNNPWTDFKPKVLFPNSKKDTKSLSESSTPLPRRKKEAGSSFLASDFPPAKKQLLAESSLKPSQPFRKNSRKCYSPIEDACNDEGSLHHSYHGTLEEEDTSSSSGSIDSIDSADELTDHEDDVPSVVVQTPRKVVFTAPSSGFSLSQKKHSPFASQPYISPIPASPRQQQQQQQHCTFGVSSHLINDPHHIHYTLQSNHRTLKRTVSSSLNHDSLLYTQNPEHYSSSPAKRSKKDSNKYFFR